MLVCARHHTLIHTLNFRLTLHPDRRLDVTTAEGVPLLHHPPSRGDSPPHSPTSTQPFQVTVVPEELLR